MDGSGMVQSGQLALYTIFQILDVDGSGTLELNEVSASLSHIHIYTHTRSDVTHTHAFSHAPTHEMRAHTRIALCMLCLPSFSLLNPSLQIEDAVDRLIDLGVITTIPRSCRTAEALHAIVKDHFEMSANQYSATQATSRLRSNEVDSLDYLEFLEFTNSLKEAFAALDGDGDGAYAEEVHRNRFTI